LKVEEEFDDIFEEEDDEEEVVKPTTGTAEKAQPTSSAEVTDDEEDFFDEEDDSDIVQPEVGQAEEDPSQDTEDIQTPASSAPAQPDDDDDDDFFSDDDTETDEASDPVEEVSEDLDELDELLDSAPKSKIKSTTVSKGAQAVLDMGVDDFDYSYEEDSSKTVYSVYGFKGEGKTSFYMSFPGDQVVLCFDRQAAPIKALMFNNDERIKIVDAVKYYVKESEQLMVVTSNITWQFINGFLDKLESQDPETYPDYIVIDGSDRFLKVAEMLMRYNKNLRAFQGFANRNIWKARRMYQDQLFARCYRIAKKGIIFTMYVDYEEIIEEGTTVLKEERPAWIGIVEEETNVTIRVFSNYNKSGDIQYYARVANSKRSHIKTGITVNVTGTDGYNKLVEASKES